MLGLGELMCDLNEMVGFSVDVVRWLDECSSMMRNHINWSSPDF